MEHWLSQIPVLDPISPSAAMAARAGAGEMGVSGDLQAREEMVGMRDLRVEALFSAAVLLNSLLASLLRIARWPAAAAFTVFQALILTEATPVELWEIP